MNLLWAVEHQPTADHVLQWCIFYKLLDHATTVQCWRTPQHHQSYRPDKNKPNYCNFYCNISQWLNIPQHVISRIVVFPAKLLMYAVRSHASPTFLAEGRSVQPPPTAWLCRLSNCVPSAAELFRLPPPPSETHYQTSSPARLHYKLFNSTWKLFCSVSHTQTLSCRPVVLAVMTIT